MALFGFGKKSKTSQVDTDKNSEGVKGAEKVQLSGPTTKSVSKIKKTSKSVPAKISATDLTGIILKPRITEKASILVETNNVYTFDINPKVSKQEVAKAVEAHYKVKPLKVNITDVKSKTVLRRGKKGVKSGGRKAMVYLRKGDKIEFV